MNDFVPRLRQLTKRAQLDKKRFELQWALPLEPGLLTHVRLFDRECFPPHALGTGEGADEPDALLELWTTLTDRNESADAVAFVVGAYTGELVDSPNDLSERARHQLT